jgi:cytochrome c oxidase subunit III
MSAAATTTAVPATGQAFPVAPAIVPERTLSPGQWGLLSFLVSEVAFFGTLIVTYVFYLGKDVMGGPTPAQVLTLPLVLGTTACLLTSSLTIHLAERALGRGNQGGFLLLWAATIGLAVLFLLGTAYEWYGLISHGLTISRNLFGTTYYTLVGLHALHVTGGVTIMLIVLCLALRRQVTTANHAGVGLVAWYWHFVDVVWIVVFTVVYLVGR